MKEKEDKKQNVPKRRFPGFTEPWEQRRLKDISKRIQGNDGRMDLPTLTISAGNGWMRQEDRFSANIAGNEQKNYSLLKKGDLSYNHGNSKLAKYGAVFELTDYSEALVPRVYHSFRMIKGSSVFIDYLFKTGRPNSELRKLISSGARMDGLLNISYEDFNNITLFIPDEDEQFNIGAFFRQLDSLITLHQRKLDDLKLLKKGLLQKMFPKNGEKIPEIRFPGFADDWEQRKLDQIAQKITLKNQDRSITETLTNSAEYGVISQGEFFDKEITNMDNISGYYVISPGDFVYNPRISNSAPCGPINRNELNRKGIMSPLYMVFSVKDVNPDYLKQFFKSTLWHRFMYLNGDTGARADRFAIKDKIFFEMPIPISKERTEQEKIGSFLNSFDTLITLHQRKLDNLKLLKKGLLQEMFV